MYLFLIWLVFFIHYSRLYIKYKNRVLNCSEKVNVVVFQNLVKKSRMINPYRERMGLYKPILKGEYEGKEFIIDTEPYSNLLHLEEGEELEILINPNNPNQFVYLSKAHKKILYAVMADFVIRLIILVCAEIYFYYSNFAHKF